MPSVRLSVSYVNNVAAGMASGRDKNEPGNMKDIGNRPSRASSESGAKTGRRGGMKRILLGFIPYWPVRYFLISFLVLVAFLALLEYVVIPMEESRGEAILLTKEQEAHWKEENSRINSNNLKKIISNPTYHIWTSKGLQVSEHKRLRKRILVMGDSFVWGDGTANVNDLWWRQLQRELIRRRYYSVDVIAAGFPGASTRDQLRLVEKIVDRYQPDLIIWGYYTNDPDEHVVKRFKYTEQEVDKVNAKLGSDPFIKGLLGAASLPFPKVISRLQSLRDEKRFLLACTKKTGYPAHAWELKLLEGKNFRRYRKVLKLVSQFHEQRGIPYFFLTLPAQPDYKRYAPLFDRVKTAFEGWDVPFHNIIDEFARAVPNKNDPLCWTNPVNAHPGIKSAHFYAVKAADILERDFSNHLGPQKARRRPNPTVVNDWTPYYLNPEDAGPYNLAFDYPASREYMLTEPLGRPFIQLNFALPTAIVRIKLIGQDLDNASLYMTAEDPDLGYDDGTVIPLGEKKGSRMSWALKEDVHWKGVNTLRLIADFKAKPLSGPFANESGALWLTNIESAEILNGDQVDDSSGRPLILYEDGIPLGPSTRNLEQIKSIGQGRYSYQDGQLYFSTSDNSDPNSNGRQYSFAPGDMDRRLVLRLVPPASKR